MQNNEKKKTRPELNNQRKIAKNSKIKLNIIIKLMSKHSKNRRTLQGLILNKQLNRRFYNFLLERDF